MGELAERTLTACSDGRIQDSDTASAPYLFLVLEGDRPNGLSARFCLDQIDAVVIGRGPERDARVQSANRLQVLHIKVPDARMSSSHVRLERGLGRWMLMDADSKNGTFLNGEPTQRATLANGDLFDVGRTIFTFREAMATHGRTEPICDAREQQTDPPGLLTLIPSLQADLDRLRAIATTDLSVIVGGESGTGKEVTARALHALSGRPGKFVAINCGALPDTLVESNLFGHKKGSFSGAGQDEIGLVRTADRGTLLLDEIGDMSGPSQAALLRVLEEKEVLPVGATESVRVDVRVVAATHRNLEELISSGGFREDLFARLAGFQIRLPRLVDRREDLGILIGHLLARIAPERVTEPRISLDAGRALASHAWPRNVRELEKCLRAATALAGDGEIAAKHLPASLSATPLSAAAAEPAPNESAADDDAGPPSTERERILDALHQCGGNQTKAARLLGISRRTMTNRLNALGIPRPRKRNDS